MTIKRTPKFRHYKASSQGFVELAGKRIYLGRFSTAATPWRRGDPAAANPGTELRWPWNTSKACSRGTSIRAWGTPTREAH